MRRRPAGPPIVDKRGARLALAGYGVGFLAFAGGLALLVCGRAGAGVLTALLGVAAVVAATLGPMLPWAAWLEGARNVQGRKASPLPAAPGLGSVLPGFGEGDTWSLNRYFLLGLGAVFLVASAILSARSTFQAVGAFTAAAMVLWVYLQDMARPLVLPHLRQNALALLAQTPALPFQCYGVWLLNERYDSPSMVWLGFFTCAAASGWMYFALRRWPPNLVEAGVPPAPLGWTAPRPFFTLNRISLITGLAAASAVAACLAEFVFPGDHALLSVGAAFLAMLLLIGSFPWFPMGAAFAPRVPPALGALLALGATALAFALGAHGQDLIEGDHVGAGLWFFLAGGIALVLALSRFAADPAREDSKDAPVWTRVEVGLVLFLVALAFAFRIWHVGTFPFGVEGDEGGGGVWAVNVLKGDVENHFINENYPLAFFSVTALFFKLAGVGIATLRWHSVFFGTLSVFTTYFFLRENMGRAAAFLATLLMSFSYWHLHYSRFGHYNIDQVATQMAAFYFVFKALRTGLLWQWGVGGFAFGLAMFPHMAGRILPFQGLAFLLYFLMARRDLLRRHLPGFLAFIVVTWAVASPALVYWNRARERSMGRIAEVSIFNKGNTNAPVDTLGGFVNNCRISMLMFNYQGDTRSRDNPVAPDKILEHWTAILFGLAFLYVLYHWREPVNFFLLGVFFLNLCASVFSVEAPQTLRTAGNIPIVFAFMALPLADLGSALRRLGPWLARIVFVVLLIAFAFFCWRSARRLFVDEKDLNFDAEASTIARTAGLEGGPDVQAVFWGTSFAASHPPMELLRLDTPLRNFYGPFEYLPLTQDPSLDHLLFFGDQYAEILPYVESIYPGIPIKTIPDQNGAPLALYVRVDKAAMDRSEGLDGSARVGGRTVAVRGMDPGWPSPGLEGARRIRVGGSLSVDAFGTYGVLVSGTGDASVRLDGKTLFSRRSGRVERRQALLAKGLHNLDLALDPASDKDAMQLQLVAAVQGPNGPWTLRTLGINAVDRNHVLRARASGFYGEYFPSRSLQGPATFEAVEPVVLDHWLDSPLLGNFGVRWRTRFKVTTPGPYRFSAQGGDFTQVKVDSKLVWRQGQPMIAGFTGEKVEPAIQLAKGWHDYEAVFSTLGSPGCDLDWTPPGGRTGIFWIPDMQPLRGPI